MPASEDRDERERYIVEGPPNMILVKSEAYLLKYFSKQMVKERELTHGREYTSVYESTVIRK